MLGVVHNTVPTGWAVSINGGQSLVQLAPGAVADVPVSIKQDVAEPVGSSHSLRIIASSVFTFTNAEHPTPHDEARQLGGVTIQTTVVRQTKVTCRLQGGQVTGTVSGIDPRDDKETPQVAIVPVALFGRSIRFGGNPQLATLREGKFTVQSRVHGRAVCLYAGSANSSPSGSAPFTR